MGMFGLHRLLVWPLLLITLLQRVQLGVTMEHSERFGAKEAANLDMVETSARVGRNITLKCPLRVEGKLQIAWIKADSRAILSLHGERVTQSGRYHSARGRGSRFLTIYGVRESDEGVYICQLNSNPMKNIKIHVWVKKPPSLQLSRMSADLTDRMTLAEGAFINVSCRASGIPMPIVVWWRRRPNEDPLMLASGKGERGLLLSDLDAADAAEYMCVAQNGEPPSRAQTFRLRVQERNGNIIDPWKAATARTTTTAATTKALTTAMKTVESDDSIEHKPNVDHGSAWWRGRAGNRLTTDPWPLMTTPFPLDHGDNTKKVDMENNKGFTSGPSHLLLHLITMIILFN